MDDTRTIVLGRGAEAYRVREAQLSLVEPAGAGGPWPLNRRRVLVGASPDCDVILSGVPGVSRRHFELVADVHGYRLRDLGSKNGTWVDGLRVAEAWLSGASTLQAGGARFRFETGEGEVEIRLSRQDRFGRLLGVSPAMREVFALLERVATSDATVLVTGPSGTGKELVADALHAASPRREAPLVVFDCSAVARELIESELFGHVKGAFTGAVGARQGAVEQANGGTLFLDEIGELDLDLQPKLLRVLERREVRRVGSNETVPVNLRVVAATHRDLKSLIAEGRFREDLYYRLAVVQVRLPSLSERPEDIPLLVEHFLREACARRGIEPVELTWATMQQLLRQEWRGNVRELRNFAERVVALARSDGTVEPRFLELGPAEATHVLEGNEQATDFASVDLSRPFKEAKAELVERFERAYWVRLLAEHGGNVTRAAAHAGVHRKSLEYTLRKLGIDRTDA